MDTRKLLILSIGISVLAIIAVFAITVSEETLLSLSSIRPGYLFLAILFHFLAWLIWSLRIKVMSNAVGGKISFFDSIKIVVSSQFFACITPSKAGGEPVRIGLLNRNGLSVGDATAVVVGERILDALVLMTMAPISLFIFRDLMKHNTVLIFEFWVAAVLFFVLLVIVIYIAARPEKVKQFFRHPLVSKIRVKVPIFRDSERINAEIDNFHRGLWGFIRGGRKDLSFSLILTIPRWLLEFVIASFILLGLNADPMWMESIAAQVILMMIVMIPITPGSSGIAELGIAPLYAGVLRKPMLGVFVLLWRFVTYYITLIVSGISGGVVILKDVFR
jgi:hypothetical protein